MFKKNDVVEILPEFQDEGDGLFIWICKSNEEKGRIDISPINSGLPIPPIYTVKTNMIKG